MSDEAEIWKSLFHTCTSVLGVYVIVNFKTSNDGKILKNKGQIPSCPTKISIFNSFILVPKQINTKTYKFTLEFAGPSKVI